MTGTGDVPTPPAGPVPPRNPAPGGRTDETPPFFGSWGTLYASVLIFLAVLIVVFYIFQASFT